MDSLLLAPNWLLMILAAAVITAFALMPTRKGRAFLLHSLKEMLRPSAALLIGVLVAAIAGSLVVAASYANTATLKTHLSGLFGIFFFGFFFAITVTAPRSLLIWALIFVPCWLLRLRIPAFWRWQIAPVVGGVLNLIVAELWNRVTPLDVNPERLHGLMLGYFVGATTGGFFMFATGCIRLRRSHSHVSADKNELQNTIAG